MNLTKFQRYFAGGNNDRNNYLNKDTNNNNGNRWSADLWSASTPKFITGKLLKLMNSSGLKGNVQIKGYKSPSISSSTHKRMQKTGNDFESQPSNVLDDINSHCLLLKRFLGNRRKIIFVTKKEKENAIGNLLDCGIRLCQYLLMNGYEASTGSRGVAIYDFVLALLSRQEFDHVHIHSRIDNKDEILNALGETYFQFATNAIKVAVNNCYWGQGVACAFSGKVFGKLIWRFPILGGYIVDSFPQKHVNHLLKLYKRSSYTYSYDNNKNRAQESNNDINIGGDTNDTDSLMNKFIRDCPDLFSWASSFRYASLTKMIFDQAKEYSIRNNRKEVWNFQLKTDVVFSFAFCTTFIRHVKMVFDYRRNSRKYNDSRIIWNQLPLYTFLADHVCVLLRDYLRFLKKKVRQDKTVEADNSIGNSSKLGNYVSFKRLKDNEDNEYYANLSSPKNHGGGGE